MRKYGTLLLIAVVLAIAAWALWGPDRGREDNLGDRGQQQQTQQPVTITFYAGKDLTQANNKLVESFNKSQDRIRVSLQEMPPSTTDQHDKYVSVLAAGSSDIDVMAADIPWAPEFASAGWLLPLDDRIEDREDFFEGSFLGATYMGKLYAIPWTLAAGVLYYRTDLLEEAGLEPPETFDELISIAKELQTPDRYGYVWQGRQYEGLVCNWLEIFWGMGGKLMDDRNQLVADPEIVAASMQWMQDLIHKHGITPSSVTTWQENESQAVFAEGRAVFFRAWPGNFEYINNPATSKVAGKVGIIPMVHAPGQKSAATLGTWNLAISKFSKHPDEAWEFIKYALGMEGQKIKSLDSGNPPSRKSVYNDPEIKQKYPHFDDYFAVFEGALPRPVTPVYPEMSVNVMQPNIFAVINRTKTAQQAANDMLAGMRQILEGAAQNR